MCLQILALLNVLVPNDYRTERELEQPLERTGFAVLNLYDIATCGTSGTFGATAILIRER